MSSENLTLLHSVLGSSPAVFLGMGLLIGWAAAMTGMAIASNWLAVWRVYLYCGLLAFVWRFLSFALFKEPLLVLSALVIEMAVLVAVGLTAYRLTHVRKMVTQYPWLYRHRGPFHYTDVDRSEA